ncbi:MAG: glycoside hydrolase family 13 protein [Candidatus Limnocylindria bacterium]
MSVETPAWVRDAIFYQVFPDRFAASQRVPKPGALEPWDHEPTTHGFKGGDLLGIAEQLDYLQDLGITALYLTPIFQSASNHRYHTFDYHTVDPLLGGNDALRELLDRAHERGMRVVLDGVFNHTGRGFWPFHHIVENGGASPYRDWFHLAPGVLDGSRFARPYPAPWDDVSVEALGYQAWWGLPALPKLDTDHPPVREYLLEVAERWLRFGIDGWRLDVPAEIRDEAFWQTFRQRCKAIREDAYLVGEVWHVAPEWLRGDRFDALMDYPLAEAILGYVGGPSLDHGIIAGHHEYAGTIVPYDGAGFAARLVELLGVYDPDVVAVQLNLLSSHDTPRALTVLGGDRAALRMAYLLVATLPGAPCVYYGDEVGMAGANDPANRGGFPWERERWDTELHAFVRAVLRLRAAEPALRHGSTVAIGDSGPALVLERALDDDRLVVAINPGVEAVTVDVALEGVGAGRLLPIHLEPGDPEAPVAVRDGLASLALAPRRGVVARLERC